MTTLRQTCASHASSSNTPLQSQSAMSDYDGDVVMTHSATAFNENANEQTLKLSHSYAPAGGMSSRGSEDSLASSTSSTSLNREPELSQSFGSTKSYNLMTPIKTLQQLPPASAGATTDSLMRRDDARLVQKGFAFESETPAIVLSSKLYTLPVNSRSPQHQARSTRRSETPSSSSTTTLGLDLHDGNEGKSTMQNSPLTTLESRRLPPGLSGRLKLNLPTSATSEGPTTPGGHAAVGARDGAARSLAPLSPFEPPTPLLFGKDSYMSETSLVSPSNSSTPTTSVSGSRPKITHRPSSQRNMTPLGMSPLAKELSSLGMRKTLSSKCSEVSSSASSQRSIASDCSSNSTLLTPPFSPLLQSKGLSGYDIDPTFLSTPQRTASGGSASSNVSSNGGKSSNRSSVSLRPKGTKSNKVAPYPSPRDDAHAHSHLAQSSTKQLSSTAMLSTQSQPASNYFNHPTLTVSTSALSRSSSTEQADDDKPNFTDDEPKITASASSASPTSQPTAIESSNVQSAMSSHLSMPTAPKMEKSMSEPAPRTVSARHLAHRSLHPVFARTYELGDELGSGGFGFVVGATRKHDGMPVAVKFIWKDKVPGHGWVRDDVFGAIPMEAFVLKVLESPFVVKFVDLFADNDFFYLVMEHHGTPWKAPQSIEEAAPPPQNSNSTGTSSKGESAGVPSPKHLSPIDINAPLPSPTFAVFPPGSDKPENVALSRSPTALSTISDDSCSDMSGSVTSAALRPAPMERRLSCDLFECIEQHSHLSEERARWVFAQIVEAVYDLDKRGICHRDIKDENCVVDANFNVKLIDFGSAVITDPRKPTPYFNRFFGTMTFAASEILQGKQYRAPHAEIWSLGVLLSILLSGECPFADPQAAIRGEISKPSKPWSAEANDLLRACLQVDPDRRATIRQVREHAWVAKAWMQHGRVRPGSYRSSTR